MKLAGEPEDKPARDILNETKTYRYRKLARFIARDILDGTLGEPTRYTAVTRDRYILGGTAVPEAGKP